MAGNFTGGVSSQVVAVVPGRRRGRRRLGGQSTWGRPLWCDQRRHCASITCRTPFTPPVQPVEGRLVFRPNPQEAPRPHRHGWTVLDWRGVASGNWVSDGALGGHLQKAWEWHGGVSQDRPALHAAAEAHLMRTGTSSRCMVAWWEQSPLLFARSVQTLTS